MVTPKSTASLNTYRVDILPGGQGNVFQVMRCEPVAQFDNKEHAAFLVDLLQKGQADYD
jgi:hypothetical protein